MSDRDIESRFWKELHEKEKKKRSPVFKFFVIALVLVFAFGYGGYKLADFWIAGTLGSSGKEKEAAAADEAIDSDIFTVLLLGVDAEGPGPARADTIMLAFVDRKEGEIRLLSIPRDTYVSIPGHGRTKINHASVYGGPELVARTASNFLDVPVDRYVKVDFEGFKNIVDILGGVEMDVEKRMYYSPEGIDLQRGKRHLDGEAALQFVRYRGATGDIGRVERQQQFLTEMTSQSINFQTLLKAPSLIKEFRQNTETNLTLTEMIALSRIAKNAGDNFEKEVVPGESVYINNVSYWRAYSNQTAQIVDKFYARNGD